VQLFKPGYWTQIAEGSLAIIEGRAPTSEIVFGRINLLNGEVLSISGTLDQILADLPCPVESFSFINATRGQAARARTPRLRGSRRVLGGGVLIMPRGRCSFRKRDLRAAIEAVMAAGCKDARVEIEGGKIVVLLTGKPQQGPAPTRDDLDEELAEFEVRHGES
jgi:hypothetical protein